MYSIESPFRAAVDKSVIMPTAPWKPRNKTHHLPLLRPGLTYFTLLGRTTHTSDLPQNRTVIPNSFPILCVVGQYEPVHSVGKGCKQKAAFGL